MPCPCDEQKKKGGRYSRKCEKKKKKRFNRATQRAYKKSS